MYADFIEGKGAKIESTVVMIAILLKDLKNKPDNSQGVWLMKITFHRILVLIARCRNGC